MNEEVTFELKPKEQEGTSRTKTRGRIYRIKEHQVPSPQEGKELVLLKSKGQWGRSTGEGACNIDEARREAEGTKCHRILQVMTKSLGFSP